VTSVTRATPIGKLALSRISYYCDLQREAGKIIPLGVIAEITVGPLRGLGLIARTQLLDSETAEIGQLLRHKLFNPFDYLKVEFDWAWTNTQPAQALQMLANQHTDSLFFAPPTFKGFTADDNAAAGTKLRSTLNREFTSFLDDTFQTKVIRKIEQRKGDAFLLAA